MMFPVRIVFSLNGKTEVDGISYNTAGMSNSGPAGQTCITISMIIKKMIIKE